MNEYYFIAFIIIIFAVIIVAVLLKFSSLHNADIKVPFARAKLKGKAESVNHNPKPSQRDPVGIDIQSGVEAGDLKVGKAAAGSIVEGFISPTTRDESGTGVRVGKNTKLGNIIIDEAAGGNIIKSLPEDDKDE